MTRQVLLSQILPVIFGENFTGSVKVSFAKDSLTLASDEARCTVPGNTLIMEHQLAETPSTLDSGNHAITLVDGKVTAVTKEEVKSKPANSRTRSAGASSTGSRFTRFD